MQIPPVYFARVRPKAHLPSKRDEDAGYDLYACLEGMLLRIGPWQTRLVPTGIASACPPDYYFQVQERGSTGSRGIAKRCGVIDSGYRGEWFLPLTNLNPKPLLLADPGLRPLLERRQEEGRCLLHYTDRAIAQAVLLPVPQAELRELSYAQLCALPSFRGAQALGSTDRQK